MYKSGSLNACQFCQMKIFNIGPMKSRLPVIAKHSIPLRHRIFFMQNHP